MEGKILGKYIVGLDILMVESKDEIYIVPPS